MQITAANLQEVGFLYWQKEVPYETAFLYFDTESRKGYYEILSCKGRTNPNHKTYQVEIEGSPNERFLVSSAARIYIYNERGQMIEDKLIEETLCDYAYYCYQDWLAAWQTNPSEDFAKRVIMWRDRFLQFAVETV